MPCHFSQIVVLGVNIASLRVIRSYHNSKKESHRNVCLIPESAHGTNFASALLAGMVIVKIKCLANGRIDMKDLENSCQKHTKNLSCIMITYPSTYGLFDREILAITSMVHYDGGQCYIDGANTNAMVGYTAPGCIGAMCARLISTKRFQFLMVVVGQAWVLLLFVSTWRHSCQILFLFKMLVVPSLLVMSLKQHTDQRLFLQFLIYYCGCLVHGVSRNARGMRF
ncbi:putative glycine dehydrogenase [decarboxylating] [Trypanosoma cruzi]|uniref:Putative glycine dehydrogenase [decarboxylating] n=1 Tax=Trypanosoma cruzi TaxID=5693 RepID=A0A2V2VA66_TRYCR|nr:putative glycine dehydrogenase [decarboxylating] [Trypanosoma cruzi]